MSRRRVVVTGMGVVTPLGNEVEGFIEALLEGRSGVGPLTLVEPAELPTRIAAQVALEGPQRFRDRKVSFALRAARSAMRDASRCGSGPRGARSSLSMGMGLELFSMPDMVALRSPDFVLTEEHEQRMTFLQTPSDLCMHVIGQELGLTHPPHTHISACAAGTDALGQAFRQIATGRRDWMLAGGADSMINPLGLGGFCKIQAMSQRNDAPQAASRPFDRERDGFVLGEGAAVLVLEARDDALERGAPIYAEIVGYGSALDAHAISEPHPEGRGALQAMQRALADAGLEPEALSAINAHGTSTPKNDPIETLAIRKLLGAHADRVPVVSTKSMIGHLIAAAGAVEAVAVIGCMRAGKLHPTLNLETPDPDCDLDYVPNVARAHEQRYVLSNSFGFGGQNASLIVARHDPT